MDSGTEAYIHQEYPAVVSDVHTILNRHGVFNGALVIEMAGYISGCVTADGHERSGRAKRT